MTRVRTFLIGAAIGVAALYLLDPERGRERRTRLWRAAGRTMRRAGRAAGPMARTPEIVTGPDVPDDQTLVDKIKSEALRDRHRQILVNVEDSVVYLRGEIADPTEQSRIEQAVLAVPGVSAVQS